MARQSRNFSDWEQVAKKPQRPEGMTRIASLSWQRSRAQPIAIRTCARSPNLRCVQARCSWDAFRHAAKGHVPEEPNGVSRDMTSGSRRLTAVPWRQTPPRRFTERSCA